MAKSVIVSDSGGLPEQVEYGKCGLITKAGDAQSLSAAIMRLYEDENLRQILVRNAREYIEHSINWDNLARKLADFLVYV
jgi:glycosyltransferase involved in cell wall biosynthesis